MSGKTPPTHLATTRSSSGRRLASSVSEPTISFLTMRLWSRQCAARMDTSSDESGVSHPDSTVRRMLSRTWRAFFLT